MRFLLHGLQSPINIGMSLRVAETFGFGVIIRDLHHVFADPARAQTIADFACGALERCAPALVTDEGLRDTLAEGCLLATTIEPGATQLPDFTVSDPNRLIVALGNEYDGLPPDLMQQADALITIPMPKGFYPKPRSANPIDPSRLDPPAQEGHPSLNVAVSAGIIAYSLWRAGHAWRHH
jgi:tRNA G18 (ribose-2'-O)-methylase SpoU